MNRPPEGQRPFEWRLTPFRITAIYAVVAALWILLSDSLLETFATSPALLTRLQTYKGWLFVLVTSALLFELIRRSTAALRCSEEALRERTGELEVLQADTQDERNRLQVLIDTAPVGIILYRAPGNDRPLLFNSAAEDILGRPLNLAVDSESRPDHYAIHRPTGEPFPPEEMPIRCALRGEMCVGIEMLIHQPSGRKAHVLANSAPIKDAKGEITGAVIILQDITAIRDQERLRDEFLSTAAHELKTPVTTIKGYTQMLQMWASKRLEPRERRALEVMVAACDRIDRRVQEMLEAARSLGAQQELRRFRFDLSELAGRVVAGQQPSARFRHLTLERDGPAFVEADRKRIEDVLVFLVDNAVRYSPENGEALVRVWIEEGNAIVSVRDHGVGIPEDRRAHIFEPFYEPVPSGSPGYLNVVPLTLYLSKLIIERHGGRIWLESEQDKGSTFYFSLPLARDYHHQAPGVL